MRRLHAQQRVLVCLAALVALAAAPGGLGAAETLKVLSYNVHGPAPIPALGSNPGKRMPLIAKKLPEFDLVLLQEDFAYHDDLAKDVQGFDYRGNEWKWRWGYLPTFPLWGLCWLTFACGNPPLQGSGVSTMAPHTGLGGEKLAAVPYNRCADYIVGGNDCFAAKGFLAVRVALGGDLSVDVYNTHLESGPGPTHFFRPNSDRDVRRAQLEQLALFAKTASADRAVIVAGDLNSHCCDGIDHQPVEILMDGLGLADSGAHEPLPNENWTGLDYILFRSGSSTCLRVTEAGEAPGFTHDTWRGPKPLSDHPAIYAAVEVGGPDTGLCAP